MPYTLKINGQSKSVDVPADMLPSPQKVFMPMRWQLVPSMEPTFTTKLSTINARSETVFNSRLYRDLIVRQCYIVPLSGMPHSAYRSLCRVRITPNPVPPESLQKTLMRRPRTL